MGRSKGGKKLKRSARNKAGLTASGKYYAKHRTGIPKAGPKSKLPKQTKRPWELT